MSNEKKLHFEIFYKPGIQETLVYLLEFPDGSQKIDIERNLGLCRDSTRNIVDLLFNQEWLIKPDANDNKYLLSEQGKKIAQILKQLFNLINFDLNDREKNIFKKRGSFDILYRLYSYPEGLKKTNFRDEFKLGDTTVQESIDNFIKYNIVEKNKDIENIYYLTSLGKNIFEILKKLEENMNEKNIEQLNMNLVTDNNFEGRIQNLESNIKRLEQQNLILYQTLLTANNSDDGSIRRIQMTILHTIWNDYKENLNRLGPMRDLVINEILYAEDYQNWHHELIFNKDSEMQKICLDSIHNRQIIVRRMPRASWSHSIDMSIQETTEKPFFKYENNSVLSKLIELLPNVSADMQINILENCTFFNDLYGESEENKKIQINEPSKILEPLLNSKNEQIYLRLFDLFYTIITIGPKICWDNEHHYHWESSKIWKNLMPIMTNLLINLSDSIIKQKNYKMEYIFPLLSTIPDLSDKPYLRLSYYKYKYSNKTSNQELIKLLDDPELQIKEFAKNLLSGKKI